MPNLLRTKPSTAASNQEFPLPFLPCTNTTSQSRQGPARHTRRTLPVQEVFKPPLSHFWPLKVSSAFNHLQAEMAPVLAKSAANVVISATTGAGKTALFEMALVRLFDPDLATGARRAVGVHY